MWLHTEVAEALLRFKEPLHAWFKGPLLTTPAQDTELWNNNNSKLMFRLRGT